MGKWNYTVRCGRQLHEAIASEEVDAVIDALIACYRELQNTLSDDDKDLIEFDIEDAIFNLENFDPEEDIDDYLSCFYDICDDVRAWISI